jgi:hypothetical protein
VKELTQDYKFKVYSFHPPEYKAEFYKLFEREQKAGHLSYTMRIEETAPPPELVKDIVLVTSASLTILKILYDFYKETKKKKGKVIIQINGEDLDLEAYNIDELKVKIESISKKEQKTLE